MKKKTLKKYLKKYIKKLEKRRKSFGGGNLTTNSHPMDIDQFINKAKVIDPIITELKAELYGY